MSRIDGVCKDVLEKTGWGAIATAGPDGPHVVATWGDYVRQLGIGDMLRVPVRRMHRTEANLTRDPRVELLCGTRQVQGVHSPGKGCAIIRRAEMQKAGPNFAAVKTELSLMIKPGDSAIPLYDTTRIYAEAILEFALQPAPGSIAAGVER